MTIGRLLAASALCAPLLLAGCSDDPGPKIAPPTASPSSSAASPEPTPEPWEERSQDGAAAFAEHWIDVFSEALTSSDTSEVRELSADDCKTCEAFAVRIEQIRTNDGFYRTPGWRVLSAAPSREAELPSAEVALRVLQGKEMYKETADSPVERNPASRATYSASLIWSNGAWRMQELTLL